MQQRHIGTVPLGPVTELLPGIQKRRDPFQLVVIAEDDRKRELKVKEGKEGTVSWKREKRMHDDHLFVRFRIVMVIFFFGFRVTKSGSNSHFPRGTGKGLHRSALE